MSQTHSRRRFLAHALYAGSVFFVPNAWAGNTTKPEALRTRLLALEKMHGGRLGVSVLDTHSGARLQHREDERFPLCSTFKLLAAARVLARVDGGEEQLDRRIAFSRADLVPYSPVTGKRIGPPGMTIAELCHAAITTSDNTAANLMLDSFGGPAGLTAALRSWGDDVTRLDRMEPELNEATPGDPRDTTTPAAMLQTMHGLLLGDVLSAASRLQLIEWLVANTTGGQRLRAGLPAPWRVGDKTGSGANGVMNDVAIVWPTRRAPVIITAYYAESAADSDTRGAVLSQVGAITADFIALQ